MVVGKHTHEMIPGSQETWGTLGGMALLSFFSVPGLRLLRSMPSLSVKPHTQCGAYGEKTLHLGLEQLVHSIWGAQCSHGTSVNT